jgi:hypothetical protein
MVAGGTYRGREEAAGEAELLVIAVVVAMREGVSASGGCWKD